MIFLVIWIVFGFICYNMAENRNRNGAVGFLAGIVFGLFAIIYYLMAGKKA